jgi:hypothetical protein
MQGTKGKMFPLPGKNRITRANELTTKFPTLFSDIYIDDDLGHSRRVFKVCSLNETFIDFIQDYVYFGNNASAVETVTKAQVSTQGD